MDMMQQIYSELQELRAEIKSLKLELSRYKGFMDDVLWLGGATCAAIGLVVGIFHKDHF